MNTLLLALSLLPCAAFAQEIAVSSVPVRPLPFTATITNDVADISFRPTYHMAPWATLVPMVKAGMLAPFGALPDQYSTLRESPYAVLGGTLRMQGRLVDSLVMGTLGYTGVHSAKGVDDPMGLGASPASSLPAQQNFYQKWLSGSAYADVGVVANLSERLKEAFFLAVDAWGYTSLGMADRINIGAGSPSSIGNHGNTVVEGNLGSLWMFKDKNNEVSWFVDGRFEGAHANFFNNDRYTVTPGATTGAEYARMLGSNRLSAGFDASLQPADMAVRPYVGFANGPVTALVAGDFRKSLNDFYPDSTGAGARLAVTVTPGVEVSASGHYARELFSLAPAPVNDYTAFGMLSLNYEQLFKVKTGWRVPSTSDPHPYNVAETVAMNAAIPGSNYADAFKTALQNSATYGDFVKAIPVHSGDDILAAMSAFTNSFGNRNYNHNEGSPENVDNVEDLYTRGRASYLNNTQDPTLVCIGSAQFAATLAIDLGKQAGIPIAASAVSVMVPDSNNANAGHAVTMVKLQMPQYGIVFVDWGKLTPTYSYDTQRALAIYQALVGIPALFHDITAGRDGHHVGYLFSEEGKVFVRNLTFHAEAPGNPMDRIFNVEPRGHQTTIERFRSLTRDKFAPEP